MERVLIIGTGLIGTSIGLALKRAGFKGEITGFDRNPGESLHALQMGAVDRRTDESHVINFDAKRADVIVLCVPVLAILDWMNELSPRLGPKQLMTDTGSTKEVITEAARRLFQRSLHHASFLPGHPMAGKESGGAIYGEGALFEGAMWLFTPFEEGENPSATEWRSWVQKFGCRTMDLDAARHDRICAWVSHLPQMVATALSAAFADELAEAPDLADEFSAIGGRALREMTRLGASPYSMWRDVAMTNAEPLAATLFAMEQRLAHLRENLKTPELRNEFARANEFRKRS